MKRILVFLVCFPLVTGITFGQEKQSDELLSNAIYQEEVKGNLEEAILIYKDIIKKYPGQRAIVAEALFHLGLSNEKLGNKIAKEYYEQLVSNYGDQPEFVRIAKERLSRLIFIAEKVFETPLIPKFTKIKIPTNPGNGVLSPDGDKLAFVSDDAVWIIPIHGKVNPNIAGEPVLLEELPGAWDNGSLMSWSANGEWIAVNGEETDEGTVANIIQVAGGESHVIQIPNRGGHSFSYRLSLSPDGQMLTFSAIEPGTQQEVQDPHDRRIFTIPISGGDPKLVSNKGARARLPSFSPDGKFIAYVGYKKGNIGELWIVPVTGGNPIKLASVNGRLRGPVWSPDGKYIAAHHEPGNNNSSKEILVYSLSSDLSTSGEPKKITLPGESYNLLAGWTPDDELGIFIQSEEHSAIYTVPASGGKAVQVTPEGQWPYYPRWSPDGKRIFFRPPYLPKQGDEVENKQSPVLYVSATGGNPVGIPVVKSDLDLTSRVPGGGFNISPDGEKIVISTGMDKRKSNEGNLWTISLTDGLPIRLPSDRYFDCRYPCWSPDGKWIAFIDDTDTHDKNYNEGFTAIYIIPAEGGNIKQITSKTDSVGDGAIAFSRNNKDIAFFSGNTIKTIPVEGGQSEVLVADIKSFSHSQLAYSPDGLKIAHNAWGKIWITSLDEGKPKELSTGLPENARLSEFAWSPDGEKIAFFCATGGENDFCMISNFLPLDKLAQKKEVAEETPKVMTSKKIWEAQDIDDSGEISPDGKYLSFTDWNTGDLVVYENATGKKRKLTDINQGSDYDQFAFSSKWSPDGSRIYYSYFVSPELSEIRSVGLANSQVQTICKIEGQEIWLNIRDLSGDGKSILATNENLQTTKFIIASITKGTYRIIKELPYVKANYHPIFTNDGTGIIYDYPQKQGSSSHDIYQMTINEKKEFPLISHPAHDIVLGLTPAGKQLLFVSSRSGQPAFWIIDFENGKTIGNPTLIKTSEYRNLSGLGFSENGAFYYCHFPSKTDIYETEINPVTSEIVTPPHEVVGNFVGANSTPDYSSDGKFLAFVSRRSPYTARETNRPIGNILCIQTLKDCNLREIRPEIPNFGFPKWSPDNRSILVVSWDSNYKMGLHKINVETGEASLVDIGENQKFFNHEWSMDGKSVFLVCDVGNGNTKLVRHHMETDKETILIEGTWKDLYNISRSPDGKWISFMGLDKNRLLKVIPAEGGEIREIHSWKQDDNRSITHCWSSDGKYIFMQKLRDPKKDLIWNLWQIPVNGDNPVNLGLEMTDIWQISAHPDGRKLVYSNQGSSYKLPQIWMMENFLPKEETVDKQK